MQPSDIGRLVAASAPKVSPDGVHVAYVVTRTDLEANRYRARIWLARMDASRPPEALTAGDAVDGTPCWSPDGRRLAFTSQRGQEHGGQPRTTLHVLPIDGPGETVTLCEQPAGITSLAWSPDGAWLAFASRIPGDRYEIDDPRRQPPRRITRFFSRLDNEGWTHDRPQHVHVVRADGSAGPQDLTPGDAQFGEPSWLPDSSGVVCSGADHETRDLDLVSDLFLVRLDGTREALTDRTGQRELPSVAPDGRRVAFLGTDDPEVDPQNVMVGVLDLGTGERRWISEAFDRTWAPYPGAQPPAWDGDTLLAGVEDRGNVHLYRITVDASAPPELVLGGERQVLAWDLQGGRLAFAATTPEHPTEIFTFNGEVERRLSHVTDALTGAVRPRPAERFTAVSTGGAEVDAWIVTPPDLDPTRRYPVLLNVHGGPFTQFGNRFFDEAQLQAAAGYVVLLSNPRGSSGRDSGWGQAIRGPKAAKAAGTGWGSVDADDVLAVVDEAVRRYPFVDGERVGVLGGSYGGYMTSWLVGHTDRFTAACSERACNNLLTMEHTSDIATVFRTELGVSHLDDPQEYLRMSPITYVRDIRTPLLIVHSEEDLRCPISQAEELFTAMRLLGKEVEFLRFPAESHELSRSGSPVHRVMRAEEILAFFAKHLHP